MLRYLKHAGGHYNYALAIMYGVQAFAYMVRLLHHTSLFCHVTSNFLKSRKQPVVFRCSEVWSGVARCVQVHSGVSDLIYIKN